MSVCVWLLLYNFLILLPAFYARYQYRNAWKSMPVMDTCEHARSLFFFLFKSLSLYVSLFLSQHSTIIISQRSERVSHVHMRVPLPLSLV